jgi:hypothetical protein
MGAVTPLFIFGMGRSGTTNALRVANAHPLVMMTGEIPLSLLKEFFATLDAADRVYSDKREGWFDRKADYMFESFHYLSKDASDRRRDRRDTALFRGHKMPKLEVMFDRYEEHFASAGLTPRYFYCARNPFDCWRSYRATTWTAYKDAEAFLAHYTRSFEQLDYMRGKVGERIMVLNLDELVATGDNSAFYRDRLFAPLGLDFPEETAWRIEKMEAKMTDKKRRGRGPALTDEDRAVIEAHPGIAELNETMFAPFRKAPS